MKGAQVLGERYVVGPFLGGGGMGIVYRADDLVNHDRVAIKLARAKFRRDPMVLRHFQREAIVGARLAHPNLVSVRDAGTLEDATPYIVMNLVEGRTLKALLDVEGLWSLPRIARVFAQLLEGLKALHAAGFVHADVKTENILVHSRHDGTDATTLIDLGLAHVPHERPVCDTAVSGTPDYMAPEVISGRGAVPPSDLYSAGVILYELLTGTTPFGGGSTTEILQRHLEDPIVPPSVRCPDLPISKVLDEVTLKALAREPAARFQTAAAFAAQLASALADSTTLHPRPRPVFSTVTHTIPAAVPADTSATRRARVALARSLREGDPDTIASATLELVGLLVANHRLFEASCTLDATIKMLSNTAQPLPRPMWRLMLVLAGVCDGLGDPLRARQVARAALKHAENAGSKTGTFRARELLGRFAGHAPARARTAR